MKMARDGEINNIAITTQDRLTRFGYKYLEEYFKAYDVTITVLEGEIEKQPEQELLDDFMALITSFSGRYYHMRGTKREERFIQEVNKREQANDSNKE